METKHTPGPWTSSLVTDSLAPNYGFDVYGGDNWVANVMARADGANRFPNKEVGEANARLIAAAPELLEALQSIVELDNWEVEAYQILQDSEGTSDTRPTKEDKKKIWDKVLAAISKATTQPETL